MISLARTALREAKTELELAYQFSANSYTYHALANVTRALRILEPPEAHWVAARMSSSGGGDA